MIGAAEPLTERDALALLFKPGFSTAEEVTDISGRGVGMDVVRRAVEDLRGQIELRTQAGAGCRYIMRLPLTLALIDAMVLQVGAERYLMPTLSVVRSVRPTSEALTSVPGQGELLRQPEGLYRLLRLGDIYGVADAQPDAESGIAVIVEEDDQRIALFADSLEGQQQAVMKPLAQVVSKEPGISGATIMPDGTVGLILDAGGLIRHFAPTEAYAPKEARDTG
ncbi:hypothetical protein EG835_12600 [bacterium]|nr:hypothetical protein [bacterium]